MASETPFFWPKVSEPKVGKQECPIYFNNFEVLLNCSSPFTPHDCWYHENATFSL